MHCTTVWQKNWSLISAAFPFFRLTPHLNECFCTCNTCHTLVFVLRRTGYVWTWSPSV